MFIGFKMKNTHLTLEKINKFKNKMHITEIFT